MPRTTRTALCILTLAVALGLPAGASTPSTGSNDAGVFAGADAVLVTDAVKCRVEKIEAERVVVLYDYKTERTVRVQVAEETKIAARSKKQFGKKKLAFSDLAKGQDVKVTFRTDSGAITKITVLPMKKT